MERTDSSISKKTDLLNRSYCEGIKRIVHQKNVDLFSLPQGVVEKRKTAWNRLFDKYNGQALDDYEIDMLNSDSEINENEKEIEEESNGDNDEMEEGDYFVKNRTPIRKLPALVQYWVDTGNPPFQLNLDNDESESSLSEEQKSSPLIIRRRSETEGKRDNSTSFLSSVDTAAYILSNTNITTKADTLAIVEGAKKSDSLMGAINSLSNASKECISTNEAANIHDNNNQSIKNCKNAVDNINVKNLEIFEPYIEIKTNVTEDRESLSRKSCDKSPDKLITQSSVKITDVLPTLKQLDKTLNENQSSKDESTDIYLKNHRKSINRKSFARKKLFTKRDSPIDLIVSNSGYASRPKSSSNFLHPALQTTPTVNGSRSYLRRRSKWIGRRKKRRSGFKKMEEVSKENNLHSVNENVEYCTRESSELLSNSNCNAIVIDTNKLSINNFRHKLDDDKKMEDLMALCKKKNLIVRLERIPSDQLPNKNVDAVNTTNSICDSTNNSSIDNFQSDEVSKHNHSDLLLIDSQDSDLSTILICKCVKKSNLSLFQKSQNHSDCESVQTEVNLNTGSKKEQSRRQTEKSTELYKKNSDQSHESNQEFATDQDKETFVDDEDSSDIFVGKFNKASSSSTVSQITSVLPSNKEKNSPKTDTISSLVIDSQSLNKSHESNHTKKSERLSSRLRITFSSDEEDAFVKMICNKKQVSNIKHTIIKDRSIKDVNENRQVSNNCSNKSKVTSKFRVIASSEDEEIEIFERITTKRRKSRRLVRGTSRNEKSRKLSQKTLLPDKNTEDKSEKYNERKTTSRLNVKLNFSKSDSSSESILPPKKLKLASITTSNAIVNNIDVDHENQTVNYLNSDESIALINGNFLPKKENLNNFAKPTPTPIPNRTLRSKSKQCSNNETEEKRNASESEDSEYELFSKARLKMKRCYVPIIKCPNPSGGTVDLGLSLLVPSNDKISNKRSDIEISHSDDAKSISTTRKKKKNAQVSLKKKFKKPNSIKRSSLESIKKNSSILTSDESSSENNEKILTRRKSTRNESKSSNTTGSNKRNLLDTIFPHPLDHSNLFEIKVFSSRSMNNSKRNSKKSQIDRSSNCGLRNDQMKFRTGMCSDSD